MAVQPHPYSLGNMALSEGGKWPRREADYFFPSIADGKEWKYAFTSPTGPSGL